MAAEYDLYAKNCVAGYPRYYGVAIDETTGAETWTEISATEYTAAGGSLGCPSSLLRGNGGVGVQYMTGPKYKRKEPLKKRLKLKR